MRTERDPPLIVFCDAYPIVYGAQRSMLQLYTEWHRRKRYRLHFLYSVDGELTQAVQELGIAVTRLEVGPLLGSYNKQLLNLQWRDYPQLAKELLDYARTLRRALIDWRADLLHCNNDRAGLMSFLGARWARCPVVTHIRRDRSFGRLDRLMYYGTNEIIWVSKRTRHEFARNNGMAEPKGRIIYNGRVLKDSDEGSTRSELIEEFGLPADAILALVAAGFDERKDHETLVKTARVASREETRLYFLLAGSDFTPGQVRRRKIEGMVHEAGLSEHVLFLGHRNDVGRLMRGVDIVVNPAKEEALGGALIEAIGYGVPCVATDTGGTAEIVLPDRCGYLVPRQDYAALARRTLELVRDDATRRTFAKNACAHFAENFTATRCANETAAFFEEIIATHRPAGRLSASTSSGEQ